MATRIRLRRMGASKRPYFRVVVTDQRSPRDGRFIENIGRYHPLEDPSLIEIDEERALHWLRTGAQPSSSVQNLLDRIGVWERFASERPSVRWRAEIQRKNAQTKAARAAKADSARPKPAMEARPKAAEAEPAVEAPAEAAGTQPAAGAGEAGEGEPTEAASAAETPEGSTEETASE